jgi:hypothetical protein
MTPPKPCTPWQAHLPGPLPLHIRRNIDPGEAGCWLWSRARNKHGYGWASYRNKTHEAHRLIYMLSRRPVPAGLVLDHLCRVRHCVNPAHMEPVANRTNVLRGAGCNRPACPQGHRYTPENTYISRVGARNCRQCQRDRARRRHARKKVGAA